MNTKETIDLTPTWTSAVQILILVLENGSEEGKKQARTELLRLARWADDIIAERKAK